MSRQLNAWIEFLNGDIRSAITLAQEQDKLIFVDVYAPWCTACKLMDETTFLAPDVIGMINEFYVPVKSDVESVEGKLFAMQENVQTLPALLILNEKGERLVRVDKALHREEMVKMLNRNTFEKSRQQKQ